MSASAPPYRSLVSSKPAAAAKAEAILISPNIPGKKTFKKAKAQLEKAGNPSALALVLAYAESHAVEDWAAVKVAAEVKDAVKPLELGRLQQNKSFHLYHVHRHIGAAVPLKADVIPTRKRGRPSTLPTNAPTPSSSSSSPSSSASSSPSSSPASKKNLATNATPSASSSASTPKKKKKQQPRRTAPLPRRRTPTSPSPSPTAAGPSTSTGGSWDNVPTYVATVRLTDGLPERQQCDYMQSILDLIEASAPHMPPMPPRFVVIVILRSGSGIAGVERVYVAGKEVLHRHKIWGGDLPVIDGAARLYVPAEDDSACDMNSLAEIFWSSKAEYIVLGYDKGKGTKGKGLFDVHKLEDFLDQVLGRRPLVGGYWSSNWRGEARRLLKASAEEYNPNHGPARHEHMDEDGTEWEASSAVPEAEARNRQICVPVDQGTWELKPKTFDRRINIEVVTLTPEEDDGQPGKKRRKIEAKGKRAEQRRQSGGSSGEQAEASAAGSGAGGLALGARGSVRGRGGRGRGSRGGRGRGSARRPSRRAVKRRPFDRESADCPLGAESCDGIPEEERQSNKSNNQLLAEHYLDKHPGEGCCPGCASCSDIGMVEQTLDAVMEHMETAHPE